MLLTGCTVLFSVLLQAMVRNDRSCIGLEPNFASSAFVLCFYNIDLFIFFLCFMSYLVHFCADLHPNGHFYAFKTMFTFNQQSTPTEDWQRATSIYDFNATDIDGNLVSLEKYRYLRSILFRFALLVKRRSSIFPLCVFFRGNVVIITNVASK